MRLEFFDQNDHMVIVGLRGGVVNAPLCNTRDLRVCSHYENIKNKKIMHVIPII